jgi:hypothetical protein
MFVRIERQRENYAKQEALLSEVDDVAGLAYLSDEFGDVSPLIDRKIPKSGGRSIQIEVPWIELDHVSLEPDRDRATRQSRLNLAQRMPFTPARCSIHAGCG